MKKLLFLCFCILLSSSLFCQTIKVKSDDIIDLKNEISSLKSENQKLNNELFQLKDAIASLDRSMRSNYLEHNSNIDRIQKSILFLGQDINDLFKGYSKNMPEKYSNNIINDKNTDVKKESSNQYSGQCNATTKKGTRCSRAARSNGYCWQHGG